MENFPDIHPNFSNPFVKILGSLTGHVQGIVATAFVLILIGAFAMLAFSKVGGNQRGQHVGIAGIALAALGLVGTLSAPSFVKWIGSQDFEQVSAPPAIVVVDPTYQVNRL